MIDILNIPLYDNSPLAAVNHLIETCTNENERKLNRCISATDAHGIVSAQKNHDFAIILKSFFLNLPDGMPSVWIGRLKGAKNMERCYGPDFFKNVMVASAGKPIRHYLCGGNEGVAEELRSVCKIKFNNRNVVGTFCPPFRQMTEEEFLTLARDIETTEADVVWLGLGTPKQEVFAKKLADYITAHFIVTVGAAFDFHTGRVKQAPKFMQKSGLEWLFRLCIEPRRLYKRYGEVIPFFIYFNLKEFFVYLLRKLSG